MPFILIHLVRRSLTESLKIYVCIRNGSLGLFVTNGTVNACNIAINNEKLKINNYYESKYLVHWFGYFILYSSCNWPRNNASYNKQFSFSITCKNRGRFEADYHSKHTFKCIFIRAYSYSLADHSGRTV
jgi:hypothetical protein